MSKRDMRNLNARCENCPFWDKAGAHEWGNCRSGVNLNAGQINANRTAPTYWCAMHPHTFLPFDEWFAEQYPELYPPKKAEP